jgi:hypothetical protein
MGNSCARDNGGHTASVDDRCLAISSNQAGAVRDGWRPWLSDRIARLSDWTETKSLRIG